jgi:hypothetical protein
MLHHPFQALTFTILPMTWNWLIVNYRSVKLSTMQFLFHAILLLFLSTTIIFESFREGSAMKHFTYGGSYLIQRVLTLGQSFPMIAENRTTISREIQIHTRGEGKITNSKCTFRYECIFEDTSECPASVCIKTSCTIAYSQCAKHCEYANRGYAQNS